MWLLASSVPLAVFNLALWAPPAALSGHALSAWIGVAVIGFYTAYTLFDVPHMALGAELTHASRGRVRVFGARQLAKRGGMFAAFGIGAAVLEDRAVARENAFVLAVVVGVASAAPARALASDAGREAPFPGTLARLRAPTGRRSPAERSRPRGNVGMLRFLQWLTRQERLLRWLNPFFGRYNPFRAEHRRDPHATWRALREAEPVYFHPVFRTWICTRYDDVLQVLRDPNFTTDRSDVPAMKAVSRMAKDDPRFSAMIQRNLLTMDGADHTRLRGLVSKAFTPRRVERLRSRLQTTVDELLERCGERGEMELVSDLAHPFPVIAIAELLGVPPADRDRFRAWSGVLVQLLDPFQASGGVASLRRATHEIFDYFAAILADRRREPRDDLLSAMLAAGSEGEPVNELDLLSLSSLLLVAGHETTSNLIGNSVVALLRNPGERKRLQEDPELITSAVDEFLRYDGPIQLTDRAARSDCEIGGRRIRKGQLVGLVLAAANRDPGAFAEPDRLDLGRANNRHLAFGHGHHFCPGSQLAKLEAEIAIGSLLRRFPDFDGDPEPREWRRSMIVRGPVALPLRLA